MREIGLVELKKIALDMMVNFDEICEKHGIRYSIAYGTLLGAVRHNGYIPWDDDIDILMPREEYLKFLRVRSEMRKSYKVLALETDENYASPLAKIVDTDTLLVQKGYSAGNVELGVYIDIFVLDYITESKMRRKMNQKKCVLLQKMWGFCAGRPNSKHSRLVNYIRKYANKTNFPRRIAMIMNTSAKRSCRKSSLVSNQLYGTENRENDVIPICEFDKLIKYSFENYTLSGFENFDTLLTTWYGDYMELPPEDKRVSEHSYDVFFR